MREFLLGMLTLASVVAALFFLRYWTLVRDRLFAYFALAFLILGINWLGIALVRPAFEELHVLYLTRLFAFVLIAAAIIDKNRRST